MVVTDYAMPGMNGLDLATEIKRINPEAADRSCDRICRIAAARAARVSPMGKPYTQTELAKVLEAV